MIIKYKCKVMEDVSPPEGERECECNICQTTANTNQLNFCCNQTYHIHCIIEWTKTSPVCPICRQPLSESVINHLGAIEYNIQKINNMRKYTVTTEDTNTDVEEQGGMDAFFDEPIQLLRALIRNVSFPYIHQNHGGYNPQ